MRENRHGARTLKADWVWTMKGKEKLESDLVRHNQQECHPFHDDEQQQRLPRQQPQYYCNTLSSSRNTLQVFTNFLSYVVQQHETKKYFVW